MLALAVLAVPALAGDGFERRAIKTHRLPWDPEVRPHVALAADLGFDAVWFHGHQAGGWSPRHAPDGPFVHPEFVELVRFARERGLRPIVSLNPPLAWGGTFRFTDPEGRRRLKRFVRLLRREAGVRDFVLAFDDQPTRLAELNDIVRYGRSAAPAHLDLMRRFARWTPRRGTVWFTAAAYADVHLGDGSGPYTRPLLDGLDALPDRVGIVWTGPDVVSPSITRQDLAATRARLGGRRLLLYDNYPVNGDFHGTALGLVLGPLRERGPDLHLEAHTYLSCPMLQLGASRLPLATVADWLRAPAAYDPDDSWERAQRRLAGDDEDARRALRVQAMEWGGWVGTRNYRTAWTDAVETAAARLIEPAYVAQWRYTVDRYPGRMADLEGLRDTAFRDDLLRVMARRLAIARAVPLVVEFRARVAAGRDDAREVLDALRALLDRDDVGPDARRALRRFLDEAGVLP